MDSQTTAAVELLFSHMVENSEQLGVKNIHLASLRSVKHLQSASHLLQQQNKGKRYFLSILFTIGLIGLVLSYPPTHQLLGFIKFPLNLQNLRYQKCTLEMPSFSSSLFRPPIACAMCENMQRIEKVSDISAAEFKKKYAYSGRPVVITDGTAGWTALQVFSFDFFKDLYAGGQLDNSNQNCQFFPYKTEFKSLKDAFNMSSVRSALKDGTSPWYIGWNNCNSGAAKVLRQHYSRPYFLPEDSESSKTDWIFMGTPGFGAHLHIDNVMHPSWQAQISGRKNWTLEPTSECSEYCQNFEVTVEPGEIFVLDTNWWFHKTMIVGNDISITIGSEYD